MSLCGDRLERCQCRYPLPRTAAQVEALHDAAKLRAYTRGWGYYPIPDHVLAVLFPHPVMATAA